MIRRTRHWSSVATSSLLVCSLLLSFGEHAHAQEQNPSANAAQVEDLLERGIELRRNGKDGEALVLFRQAADLDPDSARAQAHLGVTNQALGRWLSAETYLKDALGHTGDPYIERHRAALERALEAVKDHIGTLAVDGGPAGADVSLNGRSIGRLPLAAQPVAVGSYLLEVSLAGHYSVSRPVIIARRALTREGVELVPHGKGEQAAAGGGVGVSAGLGGSGARPEQDTFVKTFPSWVPWTLGGASAASAAVATIFWVKRNEHADRWNDDDRCLNIVGQSRETLCADERDKGEQAQTIAIVGASLSAAFAAGAIWTALSGESKPAPASAGLEACTLSPVGLACSGRF
jgi:PEGA domain-containing protein